MKKVLFVCNGLSPYRTIFFNQLSKFVDLTVIVEKNKSKNRKWIINTSTLNFHLINLKAFSYNNDSGLSFSVFKYFKIIYDKIFILNYSTLTGILSIIFLKIKKIPFVLEIDGGFINTKENILKFKLKKFLISSASYWFSPTPKNNSYLIYYGAILSRIFYYPFSSITKSEILTFTNSSLKELSTTTRLIYIGQFIKRKGIKELLYMLDHFHKNFSYSFELHLIGDTLNQELKSLIDSLNFKVTSQKFLNKEELYKEIRPSDVFVFPTNYDIWGLVVHEMMARGIPVISSYNSGAARELITNFENGFVYKNKDNFNSYLSSLLSNNLLREKIVKNSLKTAQKNTIEKMVKSHVNFIYE